MFKRILIPTDGSPIATKAARAGVALAKALGARVVGCCIVEELETVFKARAMVSQGMIDEINTANRTTAKQHVDKIGKMAARAGVTFTPVVTRGYRPHEGILALGKKHKCDVIFVATHGRGGFSKLMMGSVARKIVDQAGVPVLVYR